jgi:hypothetical protein
MQVFFWVPVSRVLIESNGEDVPRILSVRLDNTILDEILFLVAAGLRYRRGKKRVHIALI